MKKAVLYREEGRTSATADPDLAVDVEDMGVDCRQGDEELRCDLLV